MSEHPLMFLYADAQRLIRDRSLLERIDAAASRVYERLRAAPLHRAGLSEHNERYLRSKLDRAYGTFQAHTFVLALALHRTGERIRMEETTLVDYGGGTGITAMIAKEAGVGRVVYVDHSVEARHAATYLAEETKVAADAYLLGEVAELHEYAQREGLLIDAVCTSDVLEHLYSVRRFYSDLSALPTAALTTVAISGANAANPVVARRLRRAHRLVELQDGTVRDARFAHLAGQESYLSERGRIIREVVPDVTDQETARLAELTRGLRREDIERVAERFARDGDLPVPAETDPTNTCDPDTGSWMERLMPTGGLVETLESLGYEARVLPGWYGVTAGDSPGIAVKNALKRLLNLGTRLSGSGLMLAPSFCVLATRRGWEPSEVAGGDRG